MKDRSGPLKWISSVGGPFVLVPNEVIAQWSGALGDDAPTDYERACAIDDFIGTCAVGWMEALVLGDAPLDTAWLPDDDGGIFARWVYAESREAGDRSVQAAPAHARFVPTDAQFHTGPSGECTLLDAADAGSDRDAEWLSVCLDPTCAYRVETAEYQPDPESSFILHRMMRSC